MPPVRSPGLLHVVLAVESHVPAASRGHCCYASKDVQGREMESEERVERADKTVSWDRLQCARHTRHSAVLQTMVRVGEQHLP